MSRVFKGEKMYLVKFHQFYDEVDSFIIGADSLESAWKQAIALLPCPEWHVGWVGLHTA
jgi:hypothetical protein